MIGLVGRGFGEGGIDGEGERVGTSVGPAVAGLK